jgi:hypothetical protein
VFVGFIDCGIVSVAFQLGAFAVAVVHPEFDQLNLLLGEI